jgi:transcriptional regulator with GAF, ATPase, and Fis domain
MQLSLPSFPQFREVTGLLKDIGWWIAGVIAVSAFLYSWFGPYATSVVTHSTASILLVYAVMRAVAYRNKIKRLFRALTFTHDTCHHIRDTLAAEMKFLADADKKTIDETSEAEFDESSVAALQTLLQKILDNTSYAFREITGKNCTAVLLMPQHSEHDGWHFLAQMYSSDTSNERVNSKKAHRGGLVKQAFDGNDAFNFPDLSKELKKGNFVRARDDAEPFKWYKSSMMAHFKVQSERWGVLSVDSTTTGAFTDEYKSLLCAFSDALGIAFSLAETGDLGNAIYEQRAQNNPKHV